MASIDTIHHHLSSEQLTLLHRGPTYVPPCQMHLSSSTSSLPTNQILSKQFAPLRQQLDFLTSQYPINHTRRVTFDTKLKKQFYESFSQPLPSSVQQQALYETKLIQSIRRQLKKDHLILRRTADQNNVFYLGRANDFEQKAIDYMKNSISYQMIGTIDERDLKQQPQIVEMIEWINSILEDFHQKTRLDTDHLTKMQVKKLNVQLPYLYFLPELQQDGNISVQPMISSSADCPIQPLAQYLDDLLRQLYDNSSAPLWTLFNGADFIEKLVGRCKEEALRPTTRFVTLKVGQFYTMVSHDRIIEALGRFLSEEFVSSQHDHLSIDTVQRLTKLALSNNVFVYNGKVYRYVKGSPLSLPLTRTLGNIYLRDWLRPFTQKLSINEEFYGRYHDMIFLTWSQSIEKLQPLLDELDQKHPDIRITTTIGSSVHFLGAYIENRRGHLYTHVYHDPNLQPFVLPYVIGHPRLIYRQWFQWALRRAVLYCTSVEDFDQERLNIELTFLANGYSLDFVKLNIKKFFDYYSVDALAWGLDERVYEPFRSRLIQLIPREKQNHKRRQLLESNNELFHLHYLYDWGPRCQFKEQFNKLWLESFKDDPIVVKSKLEVKLDTMHCYTSNALLAQQAPYLNIK